ncbi:MiaB/RimO family radical SAM methylthiotransferase [Bombella mellum]|uniref:tRNA (N(6)-L-threonylcarbamoyladenosine(37)-C(2))-methylthiotransferase MtaB n=1 Tax=Bombella mellum TaxID=2039288 RepID=A0ABR5ZTX9_9PROT|nr:MiaB/RimO family radical SAM methylthiotransferase [Bombella mellum]MBA5727644.1 tRNA (N(6)-L-threonylcarbamoyladenosine(37)-C(2))-methylthiotransferase MtaB [Bombella mellum]
MSVTLLTFGCRLNAHESDTMEHLARQGQAQDGKTIIVNTCTVTAEAERQARQTIRRAHRENPTARIIVTGCASERAAEAWATLPGVSRVIPNTEKTLPATWGLPDEAGRAPPPSRHIRALLQVQQGCDNDCTFCVIPAGRGQSTSMAPEAIIPKARALTEAGHCEIVLTGVDIASWQRNGMGLGQLCRHLLDEVPEIARLRLSSIDPMILRPDTGDRAFWDLIADEPRFMPHLHLSLQAGSDLILKRMKRRHGTADVAGLISQVRRLRPDTGFGADVIAGFPTETEALFQETHDFLAEQAIPFLHVFPYSERPGTPAARMPAMPRSTRQERAARLRTLGQTIRDRFLHRFVGQEKTVLMESPTAGHTPEFAAFTLQGASSSRRGRLERIRLTGVQDGMLIAEIP